MNTTERIVHFYDLYLHTLSLDKDIEKPFSTNMSSVLEILALHIKKGHEIGTKKNVEVTDYEFDAVGSKLTLLLNRPDPDLSDVAYKDAKTKARRRGNKSSTEAIEVSSHVIISAKAGQPLAEVRMTMGAGVYMDRIALLLNDLYDKYSDVGKLLTLRTRPHPTNAVDKNKKPLNYKVKHRFEHKAHPNAWLKDILDTGTVQGIELIENGRGLFDVSDPHEITRKTLQIKPAPGKLSIDKIKKMVGLARANHQLDADKIRVDYKLKGGADGEKMFSLNSLDAAFTRSEKITLDVSHDQQQSSISNEIIVKMMELA